MAPATVAAKALQQNRPRPRPVVPVIPLSYIQKRQQQQAARAGSREQAAASPPVFQEFRSLSPPDSEITPLIANGSSDVQVSEKAEAEEEVVEPASPSVATTPLSVATTPFAPLEEEHNAAPKNQKVTVQEGTLEDVRETSTSMSPPSEGQSSASRSTYHMPPAFVPANQSQTNGSNMASYNQLYLDVHYPTHHLQPNGGTIMLGGFPESARSSPAPPQFNPQQYPQMAASADGGYRSQFPTNGHAHTISNGYHSNGTPSAPPGFFPREDGLVGFRRPPPYGMSDGFSSSTAPIGDQQRMSQDPSTPHSFHGSQSSAANEQDSGPAFYSQYPTAVISNGSNGHIEDVRLLQNARPKFIPPPVAPFGTYFPDQLDSWHYYLQSQFSRPEFANYIFELRYSDNRAPPLRIPGHGILFAQSGVLRTLMQACEGHDGQALPTLLVESEDRFLRSDALWLALQRLYGAPLLENGPSRAYPCSPFENPPADPFGFALGYAAAGNLLGMLNICNRGMEVAAQLLSWHTIERAIDLAIDGGLHPHFTAGTGTPYSQHSVPTYGSGVISFLHHILHFIVSNFPAGFALDTSVGELANHRRLPLVPQAGQNSRLSSIKFGDHPSEEHFRSNPENPTTATLSRLLINLPYDLIKCVLESPNLGNVQGWATTTLRQEVMKAVVGEREKRRIKALESPHVSNEERKCNGKEWEIVGWMEKVDQVSKVPGKDPVPTITKSWVDFTLLNQD
ncbi:uncharacterized protein L3040_003215 [Drepanopeziza brunnea f. sp. 'multigermtubi']|uniref:uncharacterized protein n=1 Tax=Drepanopeziza brunnea f. sp. 'multigermtubi' TaxID=698441 RepID=UPI00238C634C|nr:hypothetical protein L3040_003215 [Drepanopeziza brunnea f. sp. 'multigermtubi']